MERNTIPPIKRMQTVTFQHYILSDEGLIVDFGEMISGFINLTFQAEAHQHVVMQYSENFQDGQMDYHTCLAGSVGERIQDMVIPGGAGAPTMGIQKDEIIACQGKNVYTNTFTYHSFRYVLIQGLKKEDIISLSATYVHTDLQQIGKIKTDNPIFNELYEAAMRTN